MDLAIGVWNNSYNGALGENRTPDALLRTEPLYPLSYKGGSACNMYGALGGIRTPDLKVRNLSLYPLSYKRNMDQSDEVYHAHHSMSISG